MFRLSCLRKINPTWYKKVNFDKIRHLLNSYNKLDLRKFIYRRVAIPKANGGIRYLGVPKESWRLYQTGLNIILFE